MSLLLESRIASVSEARKLGTHMRGVHTSATVCAKRAHSQTPRIQKQQDTAAGATSPAAVNSASVAARPVFVKVGDGKYVDWPISWTVLKELRVGGVLEALASSKLFELDFKDVRVSGCSVAIVKNTALPQGVEEPTPEHETGDNVVELKLLKTAGTIADDSCSDSPSAPLFICVRVPHMSGLTAVPFSELLLTQALQSSRCASC